MMKQRILIGRKCLLVRKPIRNQYQNFLMVKEKNQFVPHFLVGFDIFKKQRFLFLFFFVKYQDRGRLLISIIHMCYEDCKTAKYRFNKTKAKETPRCLLLGAILSRYYYKAMQYGSCPMRNMERKSRMNPVKGMSFSRAQTRSFQYLTISSRRMSQSSAAKEGILQGIPDKQTFRQMSPP